MARVVHLILVNSTDRSNALEQSKHESSGWSGRHCACSFMYIQSNSHLWYYELSIGVSWYWDATGHPTHTPHIGWCLVMNLSTEQWWS